MRKNNNTIEINGKLYDAHTGDLIEPAGSSHTKPAHSKQIHVTSKPAIHKPAEHAARHKANHHASHAPSAPRTLMRHAVKKPDTNLKRHDKVQGQASQAPEPISQLVSSVSLVHIDPKRLHRAKQIPRSRMISRFQPLAASKSPLLSSNEPPISLPKRHAARPGSRAPAPPVSRPSTTTELLNSAIERSTSHLQPPPPKSRHSHLKRHAGMAAAAGLSVLVLGFVIIQNTGSVRLQMASAKAGFDASLPDYRPTGFALGQLNYGSGVVAAQFKSSSGNHHYTITQKQSSWSNLDLINNFVAADYSSYQTVSIGDRTIYLYGNHNATWVNGGVWYVAQSDGSLSDQQLIDLAKSL